METDFREILVTTIGSEAQSGDIGPTFNYQSKTYKILLQSPNFDQLLNLVQGSGFYLKKIFTEGKEHVALCYNNNRITKSWDRSGRQHRLFVANAFFDVVDGGNESMLNFNPKADAKQLTTDEFYERLRKKHLEDDLVTGIPTEVQHPSLIPVLRPYQKKGISWMLSRELIPSTLPKHWVKLRSKFNPSQELFFNKHTQMLVSECPKLQQTPKGGLLTDEMGLGKTVEVIALILMNPYRAGTECESGEVDENVPPFGKSKNKNSASTVKCICCKVDGQKTLLTCALCSTQQHGMCVFRREVTAEDQVNYVCPCCWKSSGKIIDAKTTIVVMPASIKSQWKDEIQRHVADKSFKVFMYKGIGKGWVHPTELVKYDVILTDFTLLSKELYSLDREAEERSLRKSSKKYEYPPSPLTSIRWWRIVLDEAQMVEKMRSRPGQMLKQLPSVHLWATTGTPIERDSLKCLYGLIVYLNLDPYTNEELFDQMFNEYQSGKHDDLINVVSTVMWRTSKKNVQLEIDLPKQSEVVHEVTMTDLQACYYREALTETRPQFMKKVQDYLLQNGPIKYVTKQMGGKTVKVPVRTVDLTMKNTFLRKLNNANLNVFLSRLDTLRQDCTIVRKLQRIDQTKVNVILRPEQLHKHLVKKTIDETKSAWRAVCSNINGLAAIKTAENKCQEAIKLYKQVLRQAEVHEKFSDLMLQIQAYNGLLDIAALTGEKGDNHDEYASKMVRLEWEYISKCYGKVMEINQEHRKHAPEMEKTKKDLVDGKGNWWREIVNKHRNDDENGRLMKIINTECFKSVTDSLALLENVRTTQGISRVIADWSEKIQRQTREVNKRFTILDLVVNKLRPSTEMSAKEKDKISTLAQAAFDCHLNPGAIANPTRQECCDLCKLKKNLDEFECLLFNKSFVGGIVEGTWNPRFQEKLLKAVLIYAKRSKFEAQTLEMGNCFFKNLEAIKTQFKIQTKLWVEVNNTVSAYDELKMAKRRLQLVESPADITAEDARFRLKIARDQVPQQTQVFTSRKQVAENKFAHVNGRLKYLENLKIQPTCPICLEEPQDRYCVTDCGHTICIQCNVLLVQQLPGFINCPICRTVLALNTIHTVTRLELTEGSFSPKIDEMVRCILRLKKDEPDVKILIFSHWDHILRPIAAALKFNDIEYRSPTSTNFPQQVQEFKSSTGNVTCLLLSLSFAGKGLNLIEATHVFLVEQILNAEKEMQAISRVHRIGQTKETFVHRFVTKNTIEETIFRKITEDREKWAQNEFTIKDLEEVLA